MRRREFVQTGLAVGAALALPRSPSASPRHGRSAASFHHSVCRWCYPAMTVDELARTAKALGIASVELLDPDEWETVRAHGLTCAMANAPRPPASVTGPDQDELTWGWNRSVNHEWLVPAYEERLRAAAAAGIPNLICFSGNRDGMDDTLGMGQCARGLLHIVRTAERLGVTLCMELFNSKVDHPDYMGDSTRWGVELADLIGSDRFKLLYDVYHMQIMEGDVIRTIREFAPYFAHYHTAGVPGRHEIGDDQELNYPAICRAIADTGFSGYVAQEFIPTRDPLTALGEAIDICDV